MLPLPLGWLSRHLQCQTLAAHPDGRSRTRGLEHMASAQPSVTRRSLRAAERAASGTGDEAVVQQAPTELTLQLSRRDLRPPTRTLIDATVRASLRRTVARFEPQRARHSHTAPASRHAHSAAATAPATRATHRASRPPSRVSRRHSALSRVRTPLLGQAPALGLALSVLIVIGGIGYVHTDNLDRADQAAGAAVTAEQSRRDRVDDAAADRLNGLATAVSAERRQEALEAARAAVETADAVVVVAAQVLAAETVTPLGEAAAELAEMVQQSPDPPMLSGADVTSLAATGPTVTSTASATEPAAAPATAEPATAPATAEPDAAAGPTADLRLEEGALGRMSERPAAETLAALDLETSARMLEFAQQVSQLTEQVKAASDVVTAELAAAEQAAAEQAAAAAAVAERAAASTNRKIGLANASVNGQIPREVLCSVAFDSDTLLRCDAARALEQLNAAYRAHFGQNLSVTSSYRDYDGQVEARNTRGGLAATPGTSNHGRGLAADLDGFGGVGEFDTPSYIWMTANAGAYDWIHPSYMGPGGSGPLEPWHWEYGTCLLYTSDAADE